MNIRNLRIEKGVRLIDLARHSNVPLSKLKLYERGLILPDATEINRLASVLECPVSQLKNGQRKFLRKAIPGEGYTTARVGDNIKSFDRQKMPPSEKLKVLDLFCGAGGFSHGFEQTGDFVVTAGIDLLPDRIGTFRINHPYANAVVSDIRRFSIESLKDLSLSPDVIIGGPPCQGFSSIRPFRTLTEGDPRNSLPEHYVLIVNKIRPKWFVFENVVGLMKHEGGKFLENLIKLFDEAGYTVEWKIVNAAYYGLPQNRERLIMVGGRDGRRFQWPDPTHYSEHRSMAGKHAPKILSNPTLKPAVTAWDAIRDLPQIQAGEGAIEYSKSMNIHGYAELMRNGCRKLTLHNATTHSDRMMRIIRSSGKNRWALPSNMTTSGFSTCYSRLDPDFPSVTLTVNFVHPSSNKCIHPFQDRALTPREGARLQGFPDSFMFCGNKTQVVKQIGNAVPPLLGRVIAEALINSRNQKKRELSFA